MSVLNVSIIYYIFYFLMCNCLKLELKSASLQELVLYFCTGIVKIHFGMYLIDPFKAETWQTKPFSLDL